jgi:glutathione S-transferase
MALLEKGIAFTLFEIDLFNRPAWFRTISPYGKVPLIRHGGGTVYESGIINQYLDEAFPDPPLLPATPIGRARARIWMDYCETRFLPAANAVVAAGSDPAKRGAAVAGFSDVLRFIEHEAFGPLSAAGPYFFGAGVSLVDIHYSPFFERFGTYVELGGAEWPDECRRLRHWFEAMQARPSFTATAKPTAYHLEQRRQMMARRQVPAAQPAA